MARDTRTMSATLNATVQMAPITAKCTNRPGARTTVLPPLNPPVSRKPAFGMRVLNQTILRIR